MAMNLKAAVIVYYAIVFIPFMARKPDRPPLTLHLVVSTPGALLSGFGKEKLCRPFMPAQFFPTPAKTLRKQPVHHPGCRMCPRQIARVLLQIAPQYLQVGVPHEQLQRINVHASPQRVQGKGPPESV